MLPFIHLLPLRERHGSQLAKDDWLWSRKVPEGREIAPVFRHSTQGHCLSTQQKWAPFSN